MADHSEEKGNPGTGCLAGEDGNGIADELKELEEAAMALCVMKNSKVTKETIAALESITREILVTRSLASRKESEPRKRKSRALTEHENVVQRPDESLFSYTLPETPPVPSIIAVIGRCSKPFEKQLTESDVRDDQARLSMNKNDVETHLKPLMEASDDLEGGIPVTTYDKEGREYPMTFKIWVSKIHVLTGGWKRFYTDHGLRKHEDFVTLWMFRHVLTKALCFVITVRRLPVLEPFKRRRRRPSKKGRLSE